LKLISFLQVKVLKGNLVPAKVYVPTKTVKKATNRTESKVFESVEPAAVPDAAPDNVGNPESNDGSEEGMCFLFQLVCFVFLSRIV
jgi:hypothetical protein